MKNIKKNSSFQGKKFKLVRKGGYCYVCGDTYNYLCEDCGHCRWCCTC